LLGWWVDLFFGCGCFVVWFGGRFWFLEFWFVCLICGCGCFFFCCCFGGSVGLLLVVVGFAGLFFLCFFLLFFRFLFLFFVLFLLFLFVCGCYFCVCGVSCFVGFFGLVFCVYRLLVLRIWGAFVCDGFGGGCSGFVVVVFGVVGVQFFCDCVLVLV